MIRRRKSRSCACSINSILAWLVLAPTICVHAALIGTTFSYQGHLVDNTLPANGDYDFRFALYEAPSAGNRVGIILTNIATSVKNGLFTSTLDFRNSFNGTAYWLEIGVRPNGNIGDFETLSPRQSIETVPYSLYSVTAGFANAAATALTANNANSVSTSNLFGLIPVSNLPTNVALLTGNANFVGTVTATTFAGNGAGLTNLPGDLNVKDFGARGDGITDDYGAIQLSLDTASSLGGGTVFMPTATYKVGSTIILPNNTSLRGAGMSQTIIVNPAEVTGKAAHGTILYATIGAVAATNVSVYDLTIDHQTFSTDASGISFRNANEFTQTGGPDNFYGAPVENARIERVQILGYNSHQYLIWFQGVNHGNILNCIINGGVAADTVGSAPGQEGIELGNVSDVIVEGNRLENIGNVGIFIFGSSDADRIKIVNNYINNCNIGIGANINGSVNQTVVGLIVANNIVLAARYAGINVVTSGLSTTKDFTFTGNHIINSAIFGIGIGSYTPSINNNYVIDNNIVENTLGPGYCVNVTRLNKVLMINNKIDGGYHGFTIVNCTNAELRGNVVIDIIYNAVDAYNSRDLRVVGNSFIDYGIGSGIGATVDQTPGVLFSANVLDSVVSGNEFRYGGRAETYAVMVNSSSTNVQISANQLLYSTDGSVVPFVNNGANPTYDSIQSGQLVIGGRTNVASSILDLTSTNRVFAPPRMTKAQRNAIVNAPFGGTIIQTDNNPGIRVFNGMSWMRFMETPD